MDPFEEFARAVVSGEPEGFTIPETNPTNNSECEMCGAAFTPNPLDPNDTVSTRYDKERLCEECLKQLQDSKKGKKKSRKEELEEYENDYVGRVIELTTEEIEKARAEIALTDDPKQKKKQRDVGVNRTNPRKVSDIHELTREEVEKARAEIEIIKIREPHRQSQKTISTQATILNAGITLDDCYVIFGIDQHITCDELKEQFRKLSVKYNSSVGMLSRTKEENEMMQNIHTRINQAYTQLGRAHQCGG
jgi:hypothetical protein